jgi:hypothetical protein
MALEFSSHNGLKNFHYLRKEKMKMKFIFLFTKHIVE